MRLALPLTLAAIVAAVEVPATVVRVADGGGDAVDLLNVKMDEALAEYDPGDPAEN